MRTSEYTEQFDMERFLAGEPCQDMNGCIRRGVEETRRGVKYIVNGYDNYLASRELLQSAADKQGWKMKPVALGRCLSYAEFAAKKAQVEAVEVVLVPGADIEHCVVLVRGADGILKYVRPENVRVVK